MRMAKSFDFLGSAKIVASPGRVHRSTEELVLIGLAVLAVIVVLPLALIHLSDQRWLLGLINLATVLLGAGIAAIVWVTRKVALGSVALAATFMGGLLGAMYTSPTPVGIVNWAYPAMAGVYFFVAMRWAVAINALTLLAMLPMMVPLLDVIDTYRMIASLVAMNLVAGAFAYRVVAQREVLAGLATRDTLTGVGNRRSLEHKLKEVVAAHERRGGPVSLILFDVDHFKKINDQLGHRQGDDVLVQLSRIIGDRIRLTDALYRFGGDEFVLVLTDTDCETALAFSESLRELVEGSLPRIGPPVTISLGVAQLHEGETGDAWLQRADVALYQAKTGGRNTSKAA